jgi:hypothetical protein
MDRLLDWMGVFIRYPALAAGVGAVLMAAGRRAHRRLAVLTGVTWLLYALYESGMKWGVLCSGECDIRIDLRAIYPMLFVMLIAGSVSLLWALATVRRGLSHPRDRAAVRHLP